MHNLQENAHAYIQQIILVNHDDFTFTLWLKEASFGVGHHIDNPLVEAQVQLDGLDQFK